MSGVVISNYWLKTMGNPSTLMVGTITALYDVGAVFGAIFAAFTAEPLGRKRTFLLGTAILIVGTILMGSSYERVQFMVARILTGIGIGYITSVTPVYQSEISKAAQRGWQVCCQLTTMLFGLMLAYWINYGFYFHKNAAQWRFPLLFQLVFAVYIVIVTPFLPDTPRWLMRHEESHERGMTVLAKLRGKPLSDPAVQAEGNDILEAIRIESAEEGTWSDLFKSHGIQAHKRLYLALGIQFMQQMTGIVCDFSPIKTLPTLTSIPQNIVTYYAPTLFKSSLGFSSQMAIFMGCFLQVWYILASFVTWYTIDRIGRRPLLVSCAVGMCVVLVLEAVCVAIGGTGAGIAAVIFVFLFEGFFTWGWMGCVWVVSGFFSAKRFQSVNMVQYPPEILPLKIRARGASLAAAADFCGNFLVVEITPKSLENIGWRTYIIWAVLNIVNAIIVWLFYPETAGIPLEKIDLLFTGQAGVLADGERQAFYRKLQWSIVGRASREVKRHKMLRKGFEDNMVEDAVQEGTNSDRSKDFVDNNGK